MQVFLTYTKFEKVVLLRLKVIFVAIPIQTNSLYACIITFYDFSIPLVWCVMIYCFVYFYLFQIQLHSNTTLEFLTCTPNWYTHAKIIFKTFIWLPNYRIDPTYRSVENKFYDDPHAWLLEKYTTNYSSNALPSHIVMYDVLYPKVKEFLNLHSYTQVRTQTHFFMPN